jgi:hypothetical protein
MRALQVVLATAVAKRLGEIFFSSQQGAVVAAPVLYKDNFFIYEVEAKAGQAY